MLPFYKCNTPGAFDRINMVYKWSSVDLGNNQWGDVGDKFSLQAKTSPYFQLNV